MLQTALLSGKVLEFWFLTCPWWPLEPLSGSLNFPCIPWNILKDFVDLSSGLLTLSISLFKPKYSFYYLSQKSHKRFHKPNFSQPYLILFFLEPFLFLWQNLRIPWFPLEPITFQRSRKKIHIKPLNPVNRLQHLINGPWTELTDWLNLARTPRTYQTILKTAARAPNSWISLQEH